MAGLLDYLDPEIRKMILQQQEISPEVQRSGLTNGLLTAGLGMLANSNRGFAPALGIGGLMGVDVRNQTLAAHMRDPQQQLAMLSAAAGLQNNLQTMQQKNARTKAFQELAGQPSPDFVGPPTAAQQSMQQPQQSQGRNATYNYFMSLYQGLLSKGLVDDADTMLEKAEKYRPKLKDQKTFVDPVTDQRQVYNVYEDGSSEVLPYKPDKEKLHFVDMGGSQVGVDPYTASPKAQFKKTLTPGEETTDTRSREQFGLSQQMQRDQMRQSDQHFNASQGQSERHFQATQAQPHFLETPDGYLGVDKTTLVGRPVTSAGGEAVSNGKPLTEAQAKAYAFGARMENSSRVLNALEAQTRLFDPASPANKMAGSTGVWTPMNYMAPVKAQSYMQAAKNWSEAELRFKSGAAVTPKEIDENVKIYFPQPGDGIDTIRQKAQARAVTEQSMRVVMGKGGDRQMPQQPDDDPFKLRGRGFDPLGIR